MNRYSLIAPARIDLTAQSKFSIGRLLVDPPAHEVCFDAVCQSVQPQPLKVLVALASRRGEVVTRDELMECCWDCRVVGEDVVNRAILLLRRLATDSGAFSIETVRKSGYRLIESEKADKLSWLRWRRAWLTALVILAVAPVFVILLVNGRAETTAGEPSPAVALLPPTNGGDPETRALSMSLRNAIAHMLSDTSLPVKMVSDAATARSSADFILSTDARRQGGTVLVTLQLGDTSQGSVLFSKLFRAPVEEAQRLPEQVGAYAAANLNWSDVRVILDKHQRLSPELRTDLLKALALAVEQDDPLRAYQLAVKADSEAPNSAIAQLDLAMSTAFALPELSPDERLPAVERARHAADLARSLAPDYGETYLPYCLLNPPRGLGACEDRLREGYRRDPGATFVTPYLRRWMAAVGRNSEALEFARKSLADDPYKPGKLGGLIGRLEVEGDEFGAAQVFQNATRWWPTLPVFYRERLDGMAQRGDLDSAARFVAMSPPQLLPIDRATIAAIAASVRNRQPARIRNLCGVAPRKDDLTFPCIVAFTQAGDLDSAFAVAFAAVPAANASTPAAEDRAWLAHPTDPAAPLTADAYLASPALAAMRRDHRFLMLADRAGLLTYWRSGRLPDFCRGKPEGICSALADVDHRECRRNSPPPADLDRQGPRERNERVRWRRLEWCRT